MRILLCAATEMEIAPTLLTLSRRERHNVQVLITGVGMVACTYALAKEMARHRPDLVLQAGVAGSLEPERPLSSVVAVRSDCIGDAGVEEGGRFLTLFDLKLLRPGAWPWQHGKLINDSNFLDLAGLPVVDGVTVNEISTDAKRIAYYRDEQKVQVESMEGAALHYVALLEKIPFLQIRSLSNFIGERDKGQWRLQEAIASLNTELQHILTKLDAL